MIVRYFHTLKYLKFGQVFGRGYYLLKKRLFKIRLPKIPGNLVLQISPKTEFLYHDPWNKANEIKTGKFKFLNREETTGYPPKWENPDLPLLWVFNLHYFNYAYLLEKSDFENLCLDWIKNNPVGKGTGWHSYPLSLRIVNWIKLNTKNKEIIRSIYQQASFLSRNLEFYFPGNHYLENAKALYFAGIFFQGQGESGQWLNKSIAIFKKELPVQVLSDGGYFERSPMYHAIMLHGFLDLYNISGEKYSLTGHLKTAIENMLHFQTDLTHPDGNIALFNDSTIEIAPQTKTLLKYANMMGLIFPQKNMQYLETGYYQYKTGDIYLVIDAGPVGPDYLPAHAHADIFSYEMSLFGKKFITDTGVYEYMKGEKRDYCRSTAAHNTVTVDDTNQAECWDSFRVARRYKPGNIECDTQDKQFSFSGEFNGYAKLLGDSIMHVRKINIDENIITITDIVSGKGTHRISSFVHFSPDLEIKKSNESTFTTNFDGREVVIKLYCDYFELKGTDYFPEFGKKVKRDCLVLSASSVLPLEIKYQIII